MRVSMGKAIGILVIAAILAATLFDLAFVAARGLKPWLGWMLP